MFQSVMRMLSKCGELHTGSRTLLWTHRPSEQRWRGGGSCGAACERAMQEDRGGENDYRLMKYAAGAAAGTEYA